MEYCENCLTYQDYVSLRSSVGWSNFSKEQASEAINNSLYNISAVNENETIDERFEGEIPYTYVTYTRRCD